MGIHDEGMSLAYVGILVLGVWLFVLSVVIFFQFNFLKRLTKGLKEKDLIKVLKRILDRQDSNSKDINTIRKEVVRQEEEGFGHVQKLGLVRFNPFRETGGDHSFSLAVLNGKNTGFIITGLHTRERTRIYLKEIIGGKSKTELSTEEIKAVEKAQKSHKQDSKVT